MFSTSATLLSPDNNNSDNDNNNDNNNNSDSDDNGDNASVASTSVSSVYSKFKGKSEEERNKYFYDKQDRINKTRDEQHCDLDEDRDMNNYNELDRDVDKLHADKSKALADRKLFMSCLIKMMK